MRGDGANRCAVGRLLACRPVDGEEHAVPRRPRHCRRRGRRLRGPERLRWSGVSRVLLRPRHASEGLKSQGPRDVDDSTFRGYSGRVTGPSGRSPVERTYMSAPEVSFPGQPRTAPVRMSPWSVHRPRSRWSITPFPARQKAQEHPHHDVPFRHIVRYRTSHRHEAPSPSSLGRLFYHPPVLPNQRLRELPRRRSHDRRRPVPSLRIRPPTELGATASSRPPGCARRTR